MPRPARGTPAWSLRLVLPGLALLLAPMLLLLLGSTGFQDPDEGRYAAIPYEMLARSDLVTPTLNYVSYFEKPPLLYWCVAGAFRVFGFHEWAARLVPALSALLCVMAAVLLGRAMFGARAGGLAGVVLSTSPVWVLMGRALVTDLLFTTLVFASLATWWCGHARAGRSRAVHDAAFWVLVGLAVLTKGPLALVLTFGTIGTYALVCRQLKDLVRPGFLAWSLLAVAVAAPWFVLVSRANPGFDHVFWYEQHVGRFFRKGPSGMHPAGPWFYLPTLPVLFFPWVLFLPGAFFARWSRLWPADTPARRAGVFLFGGCAFMFAFFTASSGKLHVYLLPLLPLFAVGMGGLLDRAWQERALATGQRALSWSRWTARATAALLALLGALCMVSGIPAWRRFETSGIGPIVALGVVLLAWGVSLAWTSRARSLKAMGLATAGGAAGFVIATVVLLSAMMPNHTLAPLMETIRPGLEAGGELIAYRGWLQSSGYYSGRRVAIYDQQGELAYGIGELDRDERKRWFGNSLEGVRKHLETPTPVYCLVRGHEQGLEVVAALGGGVQEIDWNRRSSIIGNAAAVALTPPRPGGLSGRLP